MAPAPLGEFDLIARYFTRLPERAALGVEVARGQRRALAFGTGCAHGYFVVVDEA